MTEFLHGECGRTGFSGEFKLEMKSAFLPGGLGVKNLPTRQKTGVQSLAWEDPLEKGMAIESNILAWEIPWTEEPGG